MIKSMVRIAFAASLVGGAVVAQETASVSVNVTPIGKSGKWEELENSKLYRADANGIVVGILIGKGTSLGCGQLKGTQFVNGTRTTRAVTTVCGHPNEHWAFAKSNSFSMPVREGHVFEVVREGAQEYGHSIRFLPLE